MWVLPGDDAETRSIDSNYSLQFLFADDDKIEAQRVGKRKETAFLVWLRQRLTVPMASPNEGTQFICVFHV